MAESNHTITLQNNRGRQVISKRDIAKQKSTSYSPKRRSQQNKGGNSHSLERKIAALKDAETREEMELNKPLKAFIKKKEKQTETRTKSPRKQARPRKSLAGLPEKKANKSKTKSSTARPTKKKTLRGKKPQSNKIQQTNQKKQLKKNKSNQRQAATIPEKVSAQNENQTGSVKTSW